MQLQLQADLQSRKTHVEVSQELLAQIQPTVPESNPNPDLLSRGWDLADALVLSLPSVLLAVL